MPQLFRFASADEGPVPNTHEDGGYRSMWGRLHKFGHWLRKDDGEEQPTVRSLFQQQDPDVQRPNEGRIPQRPGLLGRKMSRKVIPGLPRPLTFQRQNSEKRERLLPVEPDIAERRAVSVDRRFAKRQPSPPPVSVPSLSAPEVGSSDLAPPLSAFAEAPPLEAPKAPILDEDKLCARTSQDPSPTGLRETPPSVKDQHEDDKLSDNGDDEVLQLELDSKWILNLSMHFRDGSEREKFFITYAEARNRWRRVTVSCDYREAQPDSLEADLKSLHYQRNKNSRIYESIRDSLCEIQFYDTVTNLKLQTADGRLHVHVTEDVNEIIPYPSVHDIDHIDCPRFRERDIEFDSHMSGFVYKVQASGQLWVKKEIPGPDSVEEFLYEINALKSLEGSGNVIQLGGVILDNDGRLVKGLLISYAVKGALVDLLYDHKDDVDALHWKRRERWARQVVEGLSEIHEAGFVQGDFTLSNIVIDGNDDAKIIDINRRGCPVGWEPPEYAGIIESGRRVSMYIGVKSDLFQLGMVLWGLGQNEDEPEKEERPLSSDCFYSQARSLPGYYKHIVDICLSKKPQSRKSAKELLRMFPTIDDELSRTLEPSGGSRHSFTTHRSDKEYIDPADAVHLDDITPYRQARNGVASSGYSTQEGTYPGPGTSSHYRFDSSGSYIIGRRGRSIGTSRSRRRFSSYERPVSATSYSDTGSESNFLSRSGTLWEHIPEDDDRRLSHVDSQELRRQHVVAPDMPRPAEEDTADSKIDIDGGARTPSRSSEHRNKDPKRPETEDYPSVYNPPEHVRTPCNPSFQERVTELRNSRESVLSQLQYEVTFGKFEQTAFPPKLNDPENAFTPPLHQDSGFAELPPERESTNADVSAEDAQHPDASHGETLASTNGVPQQSSETLPTFVDLSGPAENTVTAIARYEHDACSDGNKTTASTARPIDTPTYSDHQVSAETTESPNPQRASHETAGDDFITTTESSNVDSQPASSVETIMTTPAKPPHVPDPNEGAVVPRNTDIKDSCSEVSTDTPTVVPTSSVPSKPDAHATHVVPFSERPTT